VEWHRDVRMRSKCLCARVLRVEQTAACRFGVVYFSSKECVLRWSLSRSSCLAISPSACSPELRDSFLLPLSPRSVDSLKVGIFRSGFFADLWSCAVPRVIKSLGTFLCRRSRLPCLYHSARLRAVSWAFLRVFLSFVLTSTCCPLL
jgi:hypothetical protein